MPPAASAPSLNDEFNERTDEEEVEDEKEDEEEVQLDEDTTDYSRMADYDPTDENFSEEQPEPKPSRTRKKEPGHHIDLEAAIAEATDCPVAVNQLEALLAKTPPELRKILEDEFSAEFLGPIKIDPSKLN